MRPAMTWRSVRREHRVDTCRYPHSVKSTHESTSGSVGSATTRLRVAVAGRNGVPADATAVVATIVATGGRGPGFVARLSTGTPRPLASIINYSSGLTYSTESIIPLGRDGSFDLYTLTSVDVIVDITGAFVGANGAKCGSVRRGCHLNGYWTPGAAVRSLGQGDPDGLAPDAVPDDAAAVMVTITSTRTEPARLLHGVPVGPIARDVDAQHRHAELDPSEYCDRAHLEPFDAGVLVARR
jgi:hypothetical protein